MIIVEGPEGSGKSYLAEHLGRIFRAEVFHSGGPPRSVDELVGRIQKQRSSFGSVLDRSSFVSELVYGPVVRGGTSIPRTELIEHARSFMLEGWILIYCRPPTQALIDYATQSLDRSALSVKGYKPADHAVTVQDRLLLVIGAYDELVREFREEGWCILNYVRNKCPLSG